MQRPFGCLVCFEIQQGGPVAGEERAAGRVGDESKEEMGVGTALRAS